MTVKFRTDECQQDAEGTVLDAVERALGNLDLDIVDGTIPKARKTTRKGGK